MAIGQSNVDQRTLQPHNGTACGPAGFRFLLDPRIIDAFAMVTGCTVGSLGYGYQIVARRAAASGLGPCRKAAVLAAVFHQETFVISTRTTASLHCVKQGGLTRPNAISNVLVC